RRWRLRLAASPSCPCAGKRRTAGSGSGSRSPGRSPTRPSSSAPDHALRRNPPSRAQATAGSLSYANTASDLLRRSARCDAGPRVLQMPRVERPRVAVKILGLFAFHVRHPKASRARQSEFVGLLPFPESDLRHFGPPPWREQQATTNRLRWVVSRRRYFATSEWRPHGDLTPPVLLFGRKFLSREKRVVEAELGEVADP